MYNIVIVEDHQGTGRLIRNYLNDCLPRLVTKADDPRIGPVDPITNEPFKDAESEPGQGQLWELGYVIRETERKQSDEQNEREWGITAAYPEAHLFPTNRKSQAELRAVGKAYKTSWGTHQETSDADSIRRVVSRPWGKPDLLITDLALSENEADPMRKDGKGHATVEPGHDGPLAECRNELRELTGFKVLRAYAQRIPVIATSFWANPLVAQHCLVNGAFAYVRKPALDSMLRALRMPIDDLDLAAKENTSPAAVAVVHYLTSIAAEVLKAFRERSARRVDGSAVINTPVAMREGEDHESPFTMYDSEADDDGEDDE